MKLYQAIWQPRQQEQDKLSLLGDIPEQQADIRTAAGAGSEEQASTEQLSLVEQILAARGYRAAERTQFLKENMTHDPFLLPDMAAAVKRIRGALEQNEMILIYGDYDADGVTATAILYLFLKQQGGRVGWYIPDRLTEGYGLNVKAVSYIKTAGIDLVVTVDCGVANQAEIADLETSGIEVVVTDHHTCPDLLPVCRAVINPKRQDSHYPFSGLAGAGVAYKLAEALAGELGCTNWQAGPYRVLATVGTIGDMMPLVDENRSLVKAGLADLNQGKGGWGMRALLAGPNGTGAKTAIKAEDIGFKVAPLLNAGSRMGDSLAALSCLLSKTEAEAAETAAKLVALNGRRKETEQLVMAACLKLLAADPTYLDDSIWLLNPVVSHPGISGIVAARLAKVFLRPVIVLATDEEAGTATGSGRSFAGFNLYEAVNVGAEFLLKFGGHAQAVGLTVKLEDLPALRRCLNSNQIAWPHEKKGFPKLPVKHWDLSCSTFDINKNFLSALAELAPFGRANKEPRLLLKNVNLLSVRLLGKDGKHLRLTVETEVEKLQDGLIDPLKSGNSVRSASPLTVVAFGFGDEYRRLRPGSRLDLLGTLSVNSWQGQEQLQFIVDDLRLAEVEKTEEPGEFTATKIEQAPEKEALAAVYRLLRASLSDRLGLLSPSYCCAILNDDLKKPLSVAEFAQVLDIYEEAGLMNISYSKTDQYTIIGIILKQPVGRVDLYQTPTYRRLSGEE